LLAVVLLVSASPQSGISLRDISAELAQRGILNKRGKPFSAADARKVAIVAVCPKSY
jgi:beta-N-acetylglucosaminidase